MEMEESNADNNTTGKRDREAQEQGESSAKRLKCSIEAEAFCCDICSKPLTSPIFQCPEGHLYCSSCSCNDKVLAEEKKCTFGSGCTGTLARSLVMERAVRSILLDCRNAEHGCTEKITYCNRYKHELLCPHAPWRCPEPGCGFAGKRAAELLEHLTGHHKWPSIAFKYWVPFDLRVVEPGTHVLECKDDGQLFLLSVQPAEPAGGLVVSFVSVQCLLNHNTIGCSVSFSNSRRHYSTSTLDAVRPWWHFGWPPTEHICFVPKVSGGTHDDAGFFLTHFGALPATWEEYIRFVPKVSDGTKEDAGVVLTINITAVQENTDDSDDSSFEYEYSDEEEDSDDEDEDESS